MVSITGIHENHENWYSTNKNEFKIWDVRCYGVINCDNCKLSHLNATSV